MQIWVKLVYPTDFELDEKELLLNQIELNALMNSQIVGSEGRYFDIEEKIFEDSIKDDGSVYYSITIILK